MQDPTSSTAHVHSLGRSLMPVDPIPSRIVVNQCEHWLNWSKHHGDDAWLSRGCQMPRGYGPFNNVHERVLSSRSVPPISTLGHGYNHPHRHQKRWAVGVDVNVWPKCSRSGAIKGQKPLTSLLEQCRIIDVVSCIHPLGEARMKTYVEEHCPSTVHVGRQSIRCITLSLVYAPGYPDQLSILYARNTSTCGPVYPPASAMPFIGGALPKMVVWRPTQMSKTI